MEEISSRYRLVLSTCGDMQTAQNIARVLVESKLAACVNILPGLTSVYAWKGQIESDNEILLLIKTRTVCLAEVQKTIQKLHSYELPEIIDVPITGGLTEYLNWITQSVKT
jgi:periplasmic divalent cation tolerance protein